MNESEYDLACDLAEHKLDMNRLRAENAKLRKALERLIKDYEDETDSPAAAARAALKE